MKLKNYKLFEREGFDDIDSSSKSEEEEVKPIRRGEEEEEEEEEEEFLPGGAENNQKLPPDSPDSLPDDSDKPSVEEMDEYLKLLFELITQKFKEDRVNATVEGNVDYFSILVALDKKEPFRFLIKLFEIVIMLRDDVFEDYESEVNLYESKLGKPLFVFEFRTPDGEDDEEEDDEIDDDLGEDVTDGDLDKGVDDDKYIYDSDELDKQPRKKKDEDYESADGMWENFYKAYNKKNK